MSTSPVTGGVDLQRIRSVLEKAGLLVDTSGTLPERAADITDDSRAVTPGALFIAVRGSARDGHEFLQQAEAQGAVAAIVEEPGRTSLPHIVVSDGRRATPIAAAAAFDDPASALRLVGVTGTNGKTTTVGLIRHLLDGREGRAASVGTLGILVGSAGEPVEGGAGLTTPGPVELQRMLRVLADRDVRWVAMEVSSHSLDQRRVEGLRFDAAVFTNLTRDHLDYHGTMEEYFAAKARLVELLGPAGAAVINGEDPAWRNLPPSPRVITFGTEPSDTVHAEAVHFNPRGSEWRLCAGSQRHSLTLPLIGDFNVMNALGAAAAAWHVGMPISAIAARLRTAPQVPGRLEIINERPTVVRDYAHTPDALERAIAAVRPFTRRRLIVVFGCGGDRDRGKRPQMGNIAERGADHVILTSDNPRTEDPEEIIDDIERGMRRENHERIEERELAILQALDMADPDNDVVLLAGKGHETYQIRGTTKLPFDEKAIVAELTERRR
ncbi:MAG TPA: UDP-N-acetylmuramoyl-L-alanyl-D-glutamate--2,6-diaminopimelate ligase [Gemmatimonadaceae bacterium]|jgi:UDP-N-acetylmuramoyl-L-alanyl-D-glutamate--2,6-diaminopimelate ligase|nr:UDP-N-acetylmuramoyl-L-alanyl-D-glutamate--2,6-diaminopimelate ligase [Gemmatimonadaceae bacterium]